MFSNDGGKMLQGVPPKTAFIFGAISGLAGAALIALVLVLVVFLRGGLSLGGTRTAGQVANNNPTIPEEEQLPTNVEVAVDAKTDHILGGKNAKVTMVEFSDFQCPFCQRFVPAVKQALQEYGDKIRLVYKHFPLDSIHPFARPAALASECASEQGKFWEYHDALFVRQSEFSNDFWGKLAGELKLNVTKFNDCVSSQKYAGRVDADYQQGLGAGVRGTPHTIVNGTSVQGAVSYGELKSVIDQALAQ